MRIQRVMGWAAAVVGSFLLEARPAHACGGCFVVPTERSTVVTGHQMAVAINTQRTILWDQIQYDGNPEEFSWVLPVKGSARLELSTDAWFDVLQATTTPVITGPFSSCGGGGFGGGWGCGTTGAESARADDNGGASPAPSVQVLHKGTVGPYETVTLRATNPGALAQWLDTHNYAIPADVQPVVDAYVNEEFDFIALRLRPGQDVTAMKPVRVVTEGAGFTLPLRMVAAGTGSQVAVTLYVVGEGRWQVENAGRAVVDVNALEWDFGQGRSNYQTLREEALARNAGNTWLTSYAKRGALLSPTYNANRVPVQYLLNAPEGATPPVGSSSFASTIGEAYIRQGILNGEGTSDACVERLSAISTSTRTVVDPCDEAGNCVTVGAGEIDVRELECGALDDLAAALVGTHPAAVWLGRMEANLPRSALGEDLVLAASTSQTPVENFIVATKSKNDPCGGVATASLEPDERFVSPLLSLMAPVMLGMTWMRRKVRKQGQPQI